MGRDLSTEDTRRVFQKVYQIFDKTENDVNQDVATIQKWLSEQHHLPEIMKETHIRNFLNLNHFDVEATKRKIDMYYTIRSLLPDFFECVNPKSGPMKRLFQNVCYVVHPKWIDGLYKAYMWKLRGPHSETIVRESAVATLNLAEIRLHEDCTFCKLYVVDLSNVRYTQAIQQLTPAFLQKAYRVHKEVFGLDVKAIYVFNAPWIFCKCLTFLKYLKIHKFFEMIHMSQNCDILNEIFTIDELPKDYGGNGSSMEEMTEVVLNKFEQYQDRFNRQDEMKVDESLRSQKIEHDQILGFISNFKNLDID